MFFRPPKRNRRSTFGIEQLEVRIVPTITVNQVGSHLFVKIDNAGETVDIDGTAPGEVDVTGIADPFTGVKNITVRCGSGDDEVNVKDVDIAGRLVVRTGKGDDTVTLDNVDVGKATVVALGAGDDTLTSTDSHFQGRAVANGGPGDDTLDDGGGNVFDKRRVARRFEHKT